MTRITFEPFVGSITFLEGKSYWKGKRDTLDFVGPRNEQFCMLVEDFGRCIQRGYLDLQQTDKNKLVLTGPFAWYRKSFIIPDGKKFTKVYND